MWFILKPLLRHPVMPVLMVLQVALACAVACNALFLLRQKLTPILAPTGIRNPARLVVIDRLIARGEPWSAIRLRSVQADLRRIPGVASVSYVTSMPMAGTLHMDTDVMDASGASFANADVYVGNNMVKTLRLQLIAGRDFTPEEEAETYGGDMGLAESGPVIITKALAARLYPDGPAVGQLVQYKDSPRGARTIVGVVQHLIRYDLSPERELDNVMLFPGVARRWSMPVFAVRLGNTNVDLECKPIEAVLHRALGDRMLPGSKVRCTSFRGRRNQVLAPRLAAVWLLSGVALIVLLVTLTGIAGMTGDWVQQRTKYIGIKRALGGKRGDILREVLIENLCIVSAGVIAGLIAAYGINVWLMQHFELMRLPWIYLPIGAVLLLASGQLAALIPARRASNILPIVATRTI